MLGHLTLLGLKQQVMPWCSDGPDEAELGGTLETTLSHWADACHRQGGTVVIPHLPAAQRRTGSADRHRARRCRGDDQLRHATSTWSIIVTSTAATGCRWSAAPIRCRSEVPVGLYRTYVRIPDDEQFSYDTWCRHLRAGPHLPQRWSAARLHGGRPPDRRHYQLAGQRRHGGGGGHAESMLPIHRLEIIQQGQGRGRRRRRPAAPGGCTCAHASRSAAIPGWRRA